MLEREKQKLMILLHTSGWNIFSNPVSDNIEQIADYLTKNGVIVPPCKVGDTVYWLDNEKVKQCEVFEISIHSDGILVHTGIQFCLEVEDVFLTPEEAEKALAEREVKK